MSPPSYSLLPLILHLLLLKGIPCKHLTCSSTSASGTPEDPANEVTYAAMANGDRGPGHN